MSSLRALVLGANGMLGHAVVSALRTRADWEIAGTQVEDPAGPLFLDAERGPEQWGPLVSRGRFDYLVNCIGVLKRAIDERDSASVRRAIAVNALFPHALAAAAETAGSRILHISTDGVFSGAAGRPYLETDPSDCADAYGRTKALGECPAANVLNLRCSIIGRDPWRRQGLMEWVLGAAKGIELPGFADQAWNGVTTAQLAALCGRILEEGVFPRLRAASGLYHVCPNRAITKYELICLVRQLSGSGAAVRRSRSEAGGASRLLATCYPDLSGMCPAAGWPDLIRQALTDTPEWSD
jgi:dTDP-4-dehydrorhamnose reductase